MRSSTVAKRTFDLYRPDSPSSASSCSIRSKISGSNASRSNARFQPKIDSRVAAGDGRSSTRQWFAGGHRHEPVSTRLKGLAEDGEGEVFCVHDPKLSFETPSCQQKMSS